MSGGFTPPAAPACPKKVTWWVNPWRMKECTAWKPLLMVIPPKGITIRCPVHPEGHFLKPAVTYSL